MPFARAIRRGDALKARFGVNGSQKDSRSLGIAIAALCPEGMAPPCRSGMRLIATVGFPCSMAMAEKTNKLKARLPRGLADRSAAEIAATRRMLDRIRTVYERYGFEPVETPAFEYTHLLAQFLPAH